MKLNFGCGSNRLDGWHNYDSELDIRKKLPFEDGSADFILCEHCVEHTNYREVWGFLGECRRILKSGGVVRIGIPDIGRIRRLAGNEYMQIANCSSVEECVRAAIFSHGHESCWTQELMEVFMFSVGLHPKRFDAGKSDHIELVDVEGHWHVVGRVNAEMETGVIEGTK